MRTNFRDSERRSHSPTLWVLVSLAVVVLGPPVRGDIIELTNGDHYSGAVLLVNLTNVTLRSDVLGVITLPRAKVATITFGQAKPKAAASESKVLRDSRTAAAAVGSEPIQRLPRSNVGTNTVVGQVQNQLLTGAEPATVQKYNEMAQGLLNGTLSIGDLRRQAQQTIQAVEQAKQDMPELDDALDGYLSILRGFVKESAPAQ